MISSADFSLVVSLERINPPREKSFLFFGSFFAAERDVEREQENCNAVRFPCAQSAHRQICFGALEKPS
jgi:hypothetical protein